MGLLCCKVQCLGYLFGVVATNRCFEGDLLSTVWQGRTTKTLPTSKKRKLDFSVPTWKNPVRGTPRAKWGRGGFLNGWFYLRTFVKGSKHTTQDVSPLSHWCCADWLQQTWLLIITAAFKVTCVVHIQVNSCCNKRKKTDKINFEAYKQ